MLIPRFAAWYAVIAPTLVLGKGKGDPGFEIPTTSGRVTGGRSGLGWDVSFYGGIPFARPPTGARRFAPPERYEDPGAQIDGTKFGPDCPGTLPIGVGTPSEDCLTLSIWAPSIETYSEPRAVMIWIYGGAFEGGSHAISFTDGSLLAKNGNVIVVGINYRLSIFGFPGAPGLADQNLGLLDQRAAVEWVRDNIVKFGGDPKKIVLFGQSAGGDSADLYSYAWTKDPIVSGFILQSGAATMCGLVTNASYASWPRVADEAGCAAGPSQLDCMRSKSMDQVLDAAKALGGGFPPKFVPMADGKVAFDDYPKRMNEGLFIKAPFIIGSNDREIASNRQMNEQEFTCPAMEVANSRRKFNVPAWRYRFFAGNNRDFAGASTTGLSSILGSAVHGSELPYVFGTIRYVSGGFVGTLALGPETTEKLAVSNEFQKVWAEFAKDPENGPSKLGWPVYDPRGNTLVRIGYGSELRSSMTRSGEYDGNCPNVRCSYDSTNGIFGALGALLPGQGAH